MRFTREKNITLSKSFEQWWSKIHECERSIDIRVRKKIDDTNQSIFTSTTQQSETSTAIMLFHSWFNDSRDLLIQRIRLCITKSLCLQINWWKMSLFATRSVSNMMLCALRWRWQSCQMIFRASSFKRSAITQTRIRTMSDKATWQQQRHRMRKSFYRSYSEFKWWEVNERSMLYRVQMSASEQRNRWWRTIETASS